MSKHPARMLPILLVTLAVSLCTTARQQSASIAAADAKDHVGQAETVCGKVVSAHYADRSNGQPTFLNLDQPYPHEIFTVVIWGNNRSKFGTPESKYQGSQICVSGKISSYHGVPEIIANDPSQIDAGGKASKSASTDRPPAGATAQCADGTYSFSQNRRGTCSHHGGVKRCLTSS